MSLRNQPYIPLYIQDYLTDEKLNECSYQTQGVYIKIMCVLHKQKVYGAILLKQNSKQNIKQNDKQNFNICLHFANVLLRHLPIPLEILITSLEELLENEVLIFDGDKLLQKRMYKDGQISIKRSVAGKRGVLLKQNYKQNYKQNIKQNNKQITEYEIEYENEINNKEDIIKNINEKFEKSFSEFLSNKKFKEDFSKAKFIAVPELEKRMLGFREYLIKKENYETSFSTEISIRKYFMNHFNKYGLKNSTDLNSGSLSKGFVETPNEIDYESENIEKW